MRAVFVYQIDKNGIYDIIGNGCEFMMCDSNREEVARRSMKNKLGYILAAVIIGVISVLVDGPLTRVMFGLLGMVVTALVLLLMVAIIREKRTVTGPAFDKDITWREKSEFKERTMFQMSTVLLLSTLGAMIKILVMRIIIPWITAL